MQFPAGMTIASVVPLDLNTTDFLERTAVFGGEGGRGGVVNLG